MNKSSGVQEQVLRASTNTFFSNYSEEVEVEAEKGEDKEEIMEAEISAWISKPILINLKVEVEIKRNYAPIVISRNLVPRVVLEQKVNNTSFIMENFLAQRNKKPRPTTCRIFNNIH